MPLPLPHALLLRPLMPELEIQLEQFKEASSKPAQLKAFSTYLDGNIFFRMIIRLNVNMENCDAIVKSLVTKSTNVCMPIAFLSKYDLMPLIKTQMIQVRPM
jgi:hypothetical protein